MRKMVFGRKLSRGRKGRLALIRSEIRALIASGKIITTKAKAKAVQGEIDKLLTLAKLGGISNQRKILAKLGNDRDSTEGLFTKTAPKFGERKSGFTKIILLPQRRGDSAEMVRIEWSQEIAESEEVKAKSVKTKKLEKLTTKKR